jgi:hypothetical protein
MLPPTDRNAKECTGYLYAAPKSNSRVISIEMPRSADVVFTKRQANKESERYNKKGNWKSTDVCILVQDNGITHSLLYSESGRLGSPTPIAQFSISSGVGCDTAVVSL